MQRKKSQTVCRIVLFSIAIPDLRLARDGEYNGDDCDEKRKKGEKLKVVLPLEGVNVPGEENIKDKYGR